jgi:hypothetical protein
MSGGGICSFRVNLADYGEFGFQEGCPVLRAARLKKGYGP